MNILDRVISAVSPAAGLRRARARAALGVLMNYDAATVGRRGSSWRPTGTDADGAAGRRARLAWVSRDMIRNTPLATRGQAVIATNIVGDGIIPKVSGGTKGQAADLRQLVSEHLDTVAIDADGRQNMYGLQRLAAMAIVADGEVFIRRRYRAERDGLPLRLQLQVLEADFLDSGKSGTADGNEIREGIEFDAIGRRVAYWMFDRHPGAMGLRQIGHGSHRVPASEVLHVYRQDRPGQMRGVSWFAPVALHLQDAADHQDAQLMRQKIAACFAGFITSDDGEPDKMPDLGGTITPGTLRALKPGEELVFSAPPKVDGYDEFTKWVMRSVAAGLGITYEALTNDLSNVNFTSYKAGRIEMDRNVTAWQWLMIIPQMMQPIGRWIIAQWALERGTVPARGLGLDWTPPVRPLIDPAREIGAMRDKVRAGFASRQATIRELGEDPEKVLAEQVEDADAADAAGLKFDSDARNAAAGAPASGNGMTGDPGADPGTGQDKNQKGAQNGGQ